MKLRSEVEVDPVELLEHFPTLSFQMDKLKEFVSNPQERARTGFPTLDAFIEGPAAGEVCTILGRSYTGKSQLVHNMMLNYPSPPGFLVFSMEMPATALLMRMASAWAGVPQDHLLEQAKQGKLTETVFQMGKDFDHHVVVEEPMSIKEMSGYLFMYRQWFGHDPAAIIIDYLELVETDMRLSGWERTERLARDIKTLAKVEKVPVFLLHQTNQKRKQWEKPDEESARGGGYTQADVVIGIHKPSRDPDLPMTERKELEPYIMVNVIKNRINGKENYRNIELELLPSLRLIDRQQQSTLLDDPM